MGKQHRVGGREGRCRPRVAVWLCTSGRTRWEERWLPVMGSGTVGPPRSGSRRRRKRHLLRRPTVGGPVWQKIMEFCQIMEFFKSLSLTRIRDQYIEKWLVVLTFLLGSCPLRRGSVYRAIVATLGGGGSGTMEIGISDSSRKGAGMGWVPFMLIVGVSTRGRG